MKSLPASRLHNPLHLNYISVSNVRHSSPPSSGGRLWGSESDQTLPGAPHPSGNISFRTCTVASFPE